MLIEVRGLANRSEGLRAGPAWALSIKVRGWQAGLAQALSIKVRAWEAGLAQGRAIVPWWIWSKGQVP